MRRLILAICLVMVGGSGMGFAAHPALATSLCVGSGPGCYSTIQQALDKADNGDVIHIESGTYSGTTPSPIVITKSVQIIGAGAGSTTIQGGGPVVTIGTADGTVEPTVSITGVTVTGGSNTSVPSPSNTRGGGILVLPAAPNQPGATVAITNSVITGNSVTTTEISCGAGCTLSVTAGGGIANFGTMRLSNTVVSHNHVIWDASSAPDTVRSLGGGIKNNGSLTLQSSTVSDNTVSFNTAALLPDAFAGGGGIDTAGTATLRIDGSTIRSNTVSLTSTSQDPMSGIDDIGGGVHVQPGGQTTIRGSQITGNSVTATGYGGFLGAASGGIDDEGSLTLLDSTVSDNHARTTITSTLTTLVSIATAGGLGVPGSATIKDTRFSGNSATGTSPAAAFGPPNGQFSGTFALGGAIFVGGSPQIPGPVTLTDSVITDNRAVATTTSGNVFAGGGGIANTGGLTLRGTTVSHNTGSANGPSGFAGGGGIWNDKASDLPAPHLTLVDSTITSNSLVGSNPAITLQGGGLFNGTSNGATVTATNTVIARNAPDNCYPPNVIPGCSS